jgi:signal transduction histidine kinase
VLRVRSLRAANDSVLLDDFYRSLLVHREPGPLYASVLARLAEIAGCREAALFLVEPTRGDLRLHAGLGGWREALGDARFDLERGLGRWLAVNERPLLLERQREVVEDLPAAESALLDLAGVAAVLPLAAASRLTGLIALGRSGRGWDVALAGRLAMLAVPAALAFEHAALVRDEEQRLRHLYRAERLATAGTIAAGLAHEIRNPLTAVRTGVQILRDREDIPSDACALLGEVVHEVDRIDRLVESLLLFARAPRAARQRVDLADLARRSVSLLAARARKGGVTMTVSAPPAPVLVSGDPGELEQVALNLLINAVEAHAGSVEVAVTAEGSVATLEVRDRGPGISGDLLDRVFEPFFTTKVDGSGLGLPISFAIVRRHGGELTLENAAGGGALARVSLPRSEETA